MTHNATRTVAASRARSGYALLELMVSLVAFSTLLAGLGSAVLIATRATDPQLGTAHQALAGSALAEQLAAEMRTATAFALREARTVEFTLVQGADVHTIRYTWSGTPGDPLLRTQNGGTPVAVLADVHHCDFNYHRLAVPVEQDRELVPVESSEQLLMSYDSTSSLSEYQVKNDRWVGNYLKPAFDSSVVRWKVTKVELRLRYENWNQLFNVQLRSAQNNRPTTHVIDSVTINSSSLSQAPQWRTTAFTAAGDLHPDSGLCLVLTTSSSSPARADYRSGGVSASGQNLVEWTGGGWTVASDKSLCYRLWGRVTRMQPGPSETYNTHYLQRVGVALQAGADASSRVHVSTPILNLPSAADL